MAVRHFNTYRERRRRLGTNLGKRGIIFVPGAKTTLRNADTEYPFRQESNFFYLTGFTEPNALLVVTGGKKPQSVIFCDPRNRGREIWTGKCFGPEGAKREFGFHKAVANNDADNSKVLADIFSNKEVIYYPEHRDVGALFRNTINSCLKNGEAKRFPLFLDSDRLLGETRLIKEDVEIATMTRAAMISAVTHRKILSVVHPGMTEVELEAEFTYRFRRAGGDPLHAYPPIVATGQNACTLHHTSTGTRIKNGELVLVDAGCEYEGYASDITRTFPANGRFTSEQRVIYEVVLSAQKAAIVAARAGAQLCAVHDAATLVICEELMALGILPSGDPTKILESGAYSQFFPHGTSHWLGLDVHDAGDYISWGDGKRKRKLMPGMVITVEPGIYIQPNTINLEKKWLGIGVRIEDDVLITPEGNRVLSEHAPKEAAEIEAIMQHSGECTARK